MAGIDDMGRYRDPRTAFGRAATASRPQIPVGAATATTMEAFEAAQQARPAAPAPVAAQPAPEAAARPVPRRGVMPRAGIGVLGPAAGVAAVAAPEALDVGKVLAAPGATGIDVATQAAEGTGRLASTGAGIMGGAKLGAMAAPFLGPLAPAGPVVGGLIGGGIGYFSADKAIKGGRAAVGADPQSPVDRIAPAGSPVGIGDIPQAAAGAADMAARRGAARDAASANADLVGLPVVTSPAPGTIAFDPKTKTYSGSDVKAGADIVGGRGRGTVNTIETMGVDGYQEQLANIRGLGTPDSTVGQGPAGIAGTTFSQDLRAKTDAMTPKDILRAASQQGSRAAGAAVQAQQVQQQAEAAARNAEVASRGQDIGAATARAGTAAQRDISTMQGSTARDVARIGAEGRTEAAAARGVERARYTPIKLPDEVSPDGMTTRNMGTALLNNDTGEIVYPGQNTGKPKISEADAATQAKAAIAAGADKAAVNKRLAELGFKPI